MIFYLLKSTIALGVLWGVYKLGLEGRKIHRFNRFYLLFSLVFAFVVPFLSFTVQPEIAPLADWNRLHLADWNRLHPAPIPETFTADASNAKSSGAEPSSVQPSSVEPSSVEPSGIKKTAFKASSIDKLEGYPMETILGGCSLLVTALLLVRFGRNLYRLIRQVAAHPGIAWRGATLVLLPGQSLPYAFLSFIFISGPAYGQQAIEPELLTHELTHVRQRHSLDVLGIELLRCVFWFNPLLLLYKRAIQLNHEFLADDGVNTAHRNIPAYQHLLLQKLTPEPATALTSAFTFHTTKQRFIMMTRHTSAWQSALAGLGALTLFMLLTLLLGNPTRVQAQIPSTKPSQPAVSPAPNQLFNSGKPESYFQDLYVEYRDRTIRNKRYADLTPEEKKRLRLIDEKNIRIFKPDSLRTPTEAQWKDWKNPKKFGIWLDGKHVPNSTLNRYAATDIVSFWGSSVSKNARRPPYYYQYQMELMTQPHYDKYLKEFKATPLIMVHNFE